MTVDSKKMFRFVLPLVSLLLVVLIVRVICDLRDIDREEKRGEELAARLTNTVSATSRARAPLTPVASPSVPTHATNVVVCAPTGVSPTNRMNAVAPRANPRPASTSSVPAARQIRLANRTLTVDRHVPQKFAALQTPSSRHTVPYLVVSELPVSKLTRDRVAKQGGRVLGFLPVNAMLVEANEATWKRLTADPLFAGVHELEPSDKIQPNVRTALVNDTAKIDVSVTPVMATDVALLAKFVTEKGGTVIPEATTGRAVLRATVPTSVVIPLAKRGDVRWIETYTKVALQNNVAVNAGLMNVRAAREAPHGLTGRGQIITTSDSGLDSGDVATLHPDFAGRVRAIRACNAGAFVGDKSGHGTHTAGSLIGTGACSDGEITGVATGAQIYVWSLLSVDGKSFYPSPFAELFRPDPEAHPAYIHSASWTFTNYAYDSSCVELDEVIWHHPDFLPVFAAGNYGSAGVPSPACAKNCLTVGATESYRPEETWGEYADNPSQWGWPSSYGPTTDGRIKPDICAPGTMILSNRSRFIGEDAFEWGAYAANTNYLFSTGTSMATPLVAGAAALTREWLVDQRGHTNRAPSAALLKAVLLGGAYDMSHDAGTDYAGGCPNAKQGWGRINLADSLFPSNRTVRLVDYIPFDTDSDYTLRVTTTNAAPLDVQLAWLDAPGEAGAALALVNDLDLVVSNETTGAVWYGNGTLAGDHTNTVESVRIASATPATYAISVRGTRVFCSSSEGGAAALSVRAACASSEDVDAGATPPTVFCTLRFRSSFPELNDFGESSSSEVPLGAVAQVTVPDCLPDGSEKLEGYVWVDDATGEEQTLPTQRLAEITVTTQNQAPVFQYDAVGRMATTFDITLKGDTTVDFRYYSETNLHAGTQMPDWWWRRDLSQATGRNGAMDDADGDGRTNADEWAADTDPLDPLSDLRILALTPTNLVWQGGTERTQIVERATSLTVPIVWEGVYTIEPPTARRMSRPLKENATNAFYRIRIPGILP